MATQYATFEAEGTKLTTWKLDECQRRHGPDAIRSRFTSRAAVDTHREALVDKILDSAGGSPALTTSLIADIPMTEFWQKEVRNLWQWTSQVVPSATVRPTE